MVGIYVVYQSDALSLYMDFQIVLTSPVSPKRAQSPNKPIGYAVCLNASVVTRAQHATTRHTHTQTRAHKYYI